jgi:hypothetical protein
VNYVNCCSIWNRNSYNGILMSLFFLLSFQIRIARSDGAANPFHRQGRHHLPVERPHVRLGRGQPHRVAVEPQKDHHRKHSAAAHAHVEVGTRFISFCFAVCSTLCNVQVRPHLFDAGPPMRAVRPEARTASRQSVLQVRGRKRES